MVGKIYNKKFCSRGRRRHVRSIQTTSDSRKQYGAQQICPRYAHPALLSIRVGPLPLLQATMHAEARLWRSGPGQGDDVTLCGVAGTVQGCGDDGGGVAAARQRGLQ